MTVVLPEVDLVPVRDALANGEPGPIAHVARQLGIELSLDTLARYTKRHEPKHFAALGRELLKLAYTALHERPGFAMTCWVSYTLLVVRDGDRLVIGTQRNAGRSRPFPDGGWQIGRWYKDPGRNRPTVEAWARDPARARDALVVPIVRAPALAAPDSRGEALLAAVVANPDDEAARLVYADWLIERGDVRGELIRVQCELANPSVVRYEELRLREYELLAAVGDGIRSAVQPFAEHVQIARGLIDGVTMHVVKLAKYGPALVADHPIRRLRAVVNGPDQLARVAKLPFLARIPALEIEARRTPKIHFSSVAVKPSLLARSLATTRLLGLSCLADTATEWERFADAIAAPQLETLAIDNASCELPAFARLASQLPKLRAVELEYPPFAQPRSKAPPLVEAISALAVRPLHRFRMGSWHIADDVIARCVHALLACPTFASLELVNSSVQARTIEVILERGGQLEQLALGNRATSAELLVTLFEGARLSALRSLELSLHDEPTPDILARLVDAILALPSLAQLRWREGQLTGPQRARLGARFCFDYRRS